MKTFFQKVILVLYGWRIHNVVYRTQNYYTNDFVTGHYPMMWKKGKNTAHGHPYHPVDLAWFKQFGFKSSKRVIIATIFGDLFSFGLVIWFIIWLILSIHRTF